MAILQVSGLTKGYGGIRALDAVSISVGAGEAVGLIGPNGAGKTTLFDCISGLIRPDAGTVEFDGQRIDNLPVYRRSRLGIGRTFQRIELFAGMTLHEHFLVAERQRRGDGRLWKDLLWKGAPRPSELERVRLLTAELGLEALASSPIEALSLGQGRLVELGRALITAPRLLLLDEPSSGLDARESAALAHVLNAVRQGRELAVLVVEHDLDLVRAVSERAYALDTGRVIAEGPLIDVLQTASVRAAYLGES
ncbi:MAG: ABC transporter ATP-binding protein [Acidimicrobiales bacterium]